MKQSGLDDLGGVVWWFLTLHRRIDGRGSATSSLDARLT